MKTLFVLFNHRLTEDQRVNARAELDVEAFAEPPDEVRVLWSDLPPQPAALSPALGPVFDWLGGEARPGDCVLVQGDFGATFLVVLWCRERGLAPVYATTQREASDQADADGAVRTSHTFRHVRYRKYGE